MNDYSWFKLLLMAIGVLLLGMAVPNVLSTASTIIWWATEGSAASFGSSTRLAWALAGGGLGGVAQLCFAIYLLRGGGRLTERCVASVLGRCVSCGYDVGSIKSVTCPECGVLLPGRSLVAYSPTQPSATPPAAPSEDVRAE